jgi:uncharacterized membrane protein YgdD (TMEM256/DUF423 family)
MAPLQPCRYRILWRGIIKQDHVMRLWLTLAALNGFIAVALGAVGSHALRNTLSPERLGWIETGLRYHMFHALALFGVAILFALEGGREGWALRIAAWCFLGGLVLFSGGLYLMGLAGIRSLGPTVPTGGMLFLAGWAALVAHALTRG